MVITESAVQTALSLMPRVAFLPSYVAHAAKRSEAHVGYQALAALSLLTQTVPTQLALSYGTDLYSNELFLLIGPSGSGRKGTAVQTAQRILSDGEWGLEGALPKALAPGDIASDEGMQDLVARQPRFLIAIEEFGGFLQKTAAPQHARLRLTFNNLFDASMSAFGRIRVESRNRSRTAEMKSPRGTALVASTPQYLIEYTRRVDWMGGFMSRWFTLYPQDARQMEPPPSPNVDELRNLIALLRKKEREPVAPTLRCAGRTPVADAIWREWCQNTRAQVKALKNEVARTVLQRLEAHALKIALLIAWDLGECYFDNWLLSARALAPALHLTNLHASSMLRIVQEIPTNDEAAERQRVYAAIAFAPACTSRAVLLQTIGISAKRLEAHVRTLLQAQLVTAQGCDSDANVVFSRMVGAQTRVDSFEDITFWTPAVDAAAADRLGAGGVDSSEIALAATHARIAAAAAEDERTIADVVI